MPGPGPSGSSGSRIPWTREDAASALRRQAAVERDDLVRDRSPAELLDGARAAGPAHRAGALAIGEQLVHGRGEVGGEPCRVDGVARGAELDGDEEPGLAVDDDLGDAADGRGDNR